MELRGIDRALEVFHDKLDDGSEGPAMVVVPAGEFGMGSPSYENGRESNETFHRVRIEQPFVIGQYEVTVGQFQRFIAATGYRTDAERNADGKSGCFSYSDEKWDWRSGTNWRQPGFTQSETHPVVCVSWNDARAYAEWLSARTSRQYRLPTEAEWEYAARAGTTTAYWWGNQASHDYANYGTDQCCKGLAQGKDRWEFTAPVGAFQPNPWKLYDMAGNVWEWTCSLYDGGYGGAEKVCNNNDTTSPRALRGGSWLEDPARVRSARRDRGDPSYRYHYVGFRLARSL